MREWLRETHGPRFELFRHFLGRFFDSDLVTSPEQTRSALIGAVAVILPWFQLFYGPLKEKYAHFSSLPTPALYREAVRADELWLITLAMSVIGLLAALKWQSLFPDLRDYRVLGALPLRPREIFLAKLLALLAVAAAALLATTWFPSAAFPALSKSRWEFPAAPGARFSAMELATAAGCAFFFLAMVGMQGMLLNLLRPRAFRRFAGTVQGMLVALMLGLIVLSFSIDQAVTARLVQPQWSRWLPPVWFLGICQARSGNPDPAMHALAERAAWALILAGAIALASYLISYGRRSILLVEGSGSPVQTRRSSRLLGWILPDPRQQGVAGFMLGTLARSGNHRTILMGYGGLAFAAMLTVFGGVSTSLARFLLLHVIVIVALLLAARHLFSIPTELKANWIFQLTERESQGEWMELVDRFVLFWAALAWILPLPFEIWFAGWRGMGEALLTAVLGLAIYEWLFSSWNKLPFTCSYAPGKTAGWIVVLRFLALAAAIQTGYLLLMAAFDHLLAYLAILGPAAFAWTRIRAQRRDGWQDLRLKYEDAPDPEIHALHLLR